MALIGEDTPHFFSGEFGITAARQIH